MGEAGSGCGLEGAEGLEALRVCPSGSGVMRREHGEQEEEDVEEGVEADVHAAVGAGAGDGQVDDEGGSDDAADREEDPPRALDHLALAAPPGPGVSTVENMPPLFRERIERFRRTKPDWGSNHEPYEVFVCEQAILFLNVLKPVDALRAFAAARHEEQRRLVPGLSDEHSGNTFGAAVRLAHVAMERPELLPKMHGALCPLVGCKDYGCWAAHEAETEGA